MPYKDPKAEKAKQERYRKRHAARILARNRRWKEENPERYRSVMDQWQLTVKTEVLSHYGPDGQLRCSWVNCEITDLDMLTLDHINNDGGGRDREHGGGVKLCSRLRRTGFPLGFQTLCWNHQWKKEALRRREARKA